MGTRDIPDGVNHRHDDEAKRQGHADMRDRTTGYVVDDDGSRAREHKAERAEDFGNVLLQRS